MSLGYEPRTVRYPVLMIAIINAFQPPFGKFYLFAIT